MFKLNRVLLAVALLSSAVISLPFVTDAVFDGIGLEKKSAFRMPFTTENRIFGGKEAAIGQFPYQVSLRVIPWPTDQHIHLCGGSILTNRFVLTAGQCIFWNLPIVWYRVVVGAHKFNDTDGQLYNVSRVILHEDIFLGLNGTVKNDIGLVETNTIIEFNKLVAPIALNSKFFDDGARAVTTGWGASNVNIDFDS